MVWSYSGLTFQGKDYVRFIIGDTDPTTPILEDHEIQAMLTLYPNELEASAYLCTGLASQYAAEGDLDVDGYHFKNLEKAEFFRQRAKDLFIQISGRSTPIALAGLSYGGVDKATKEANRQDATIVQPSFYRGQFEDPNTSDSVDGEDE